MFMFCTKLAAYIKVCDIISGRILFSSLNHYCGTHIKILCFKTEIISFLIRQLSEQFNTAENMTHIYSMSCLIFPQLQNPVPCISLYKSCSISNTVYD